MKYFYTAPSDYSSASGNFDMTDSNTVQCIPISIVSDGNNENSDECFTYTISTTNTATAFTLNPTSATVCISDEEESKSFYVVHNYIYLQKSSYVAYFYSLNHFMAVSVMIGLQQSYYSTVEGQGPVNICITVLSGDINENIFTINYSTSNGLAEGIKHPYPH